MEVFERSFSGDQNPPDLFAGLPLKLEIPKEFDRMSLLDLARLGNFFNPEETKWTKKRLRVLHKAYRLFLGKDGHQSLYQFYLTHEVGLPTAASDLCEPYFIYLLCRNKGMCISKPSLPEMRSFIRWSSFSKEDLIKLASHSLAKKDTAYLIAAVDLAKEEKVRNLRGMTTAQRKALIPYNDEEAIILGALNYQINLVRDKEPQISYIVYSPAKKYAPLASRYEPGIPSWAYSPELASSLLVKEGFSAFEVESNGVEPLFQLLPLENNFYEAQEQDLPRLLSKETPFYQHKVAETPLEDLLVYGLVNSPDSPLQALTLEELSAFLESELAFLNPFSKEEKLSPRAVSKLYGLKNTGLNLVLDKVKKVNEANQGSARELLLHKDRNKCIKALKSLMDLSFYMRGWLGRPQEIPLVNTEVKDQGLVDLKVTEALALFSDSLKGCSIVGALPLMHYENGSYSSSSDKNKGLTIIDRINIVKEEHSNVNSCIRLSSNWLLSSAYFYLSLLEEKLNFDIGKMRIIS